jgi:hypothetical protein
MGYVLAAFATVILCTAPGCSSEGAETKGGERRAPSVPATTGAAIPKAGFVRTCASSAYGTLDSGAWREHSIIAGPVAFYYADQYRAKAASELAPVRGKSDRYPGQKMLLLVHADAVATVAVPQGVRGSVALLYNPAAWNDRNEYTIDDGENAVRFRACKRGQTPPTGGRPNAMTQFNGAFVVAGARCVPLDVFVRGKRPIRINLSFGAGRCG